MRKPNLYKFTQFIPIFIAFALIGCGLSTTSLDEPMSDALNPANNPLEGIAAAGSPLNGIVFLKASSSAMTISTKVDDSGYYIFSDNEIDAIGGTSPYVLKVEGTLGGEKHILYSIARSRGRVNLNPISDLALSLSALNNDARQVFENTSLIPSQASYENAVSNLKSAIEPLLLSLQLNDINPITDELKSDGTGFDGIFDLVKFDSIEGNSGEVTSVVFRDYSGIELGETDVNSIGSVVLTTANLTNLKFVPDNLAEIRNLLESLRASLSATSVTSGMLNSLINSNFTTHSGRTQSQFVQYLIDNNPATLRTSNQTLVSIKNLVILKVEDPVNNIFKIDFKYVYSDGSQISPPDPFYVQRFNNEWKFTSNSKISDISNIYPLTRVYVDTDGVYKMFSGINFEVWEHNNQFDNVLIHGNGLPLSGIQLEKSPDNSKRLVLVNSLRNIDLPMDQDSFYSMDDETISNLEIDQQVTVSIRNSSNVTIETRILNLASKPILLNNWDPSHFPIIDGLQSHSILEANIGSNLNFTYSSPSITPQTLFLGNGLLTKLEIVGSSEESQPDKYYTLAIPNKNPLSASITSSSLSSSSSAALELNMVDGTGRQLSTKYIFGEVELNARLVGFQQNPTPVDTTSIATAEVKISADWTQMQVSLNIQNMSSASNMYIRYGEAGSTGPILFDLGSFSNQKTVTFTSQNLFVSAANNIDDFTDAMNAVTSGKTYINIHTAENPSGHIRGQIGAVYLKAELDGRNEINISNSNATGEVHFQTNGKQDRIYVRIISSGLSNVNAVIVARGTVGQDLGNILVINEAQNDINFPLNKIINASKVVQNIPAGVQNFEEAISYLFAGETYFNIKTPTYPLGEIRGQIGPFRMKSELLADNVVPRATNTGFANGSFTLNFNASQTEIATNLIGNSLISNPTSANIKIGESDQVGNILFNLSRGANVPSLNVFSVLDINDLNSNAASVGTSKFTDVVRLIERQSAYVEIITFNHATGILRGQIVP